MAEFRKTEEQESDKKPKFIPQKSDHKLREDMRKLEGYGVGPNVTSRRAVAVIGGMLAVKLGLTPHFDFFDKKNCFSDLAWHRFELSLTKAPAAGAVYEALC